MILQAPAHQINSPAASRPRPPHPDDSRDARASAILDDLFRAGSGRSPDRVRHLFGQLRAIDPRLASSLMAATAGAVSR